MIETRQRQGSATNPPSSSATPCATWVQQNKRCEGPDVPESLVKVFS